ncbi:MAG TPA: hypothetical protein VKR56_10775 [Candidatus Cybelea sp.]|nr:hypothetical protein [Candidatus Cybelea sp.]
MSNGLRFCAIALALGGCAGSPAQLAPVAAPAHRIETPRDDGRGSWMSPEAKRSDLLYVSDYNAYEVYAYSYPRGKLEGTLRGFGPYPAGLCVDKKQNVWVSVLDGYELIEYAHGGSSPLRTLSDAHEFPIGCSVDPTTGNLAVANLVSSYGDGSVSVFADASGTATTYSDSDIREVWACGYDNQGDLFVDGVNDSDLFEFAELPKGSGTLTTIALDQSIEWPGGIQWDGKYLAVGDAEAGVIYQTNGGGGHVVGSTTLDSTDYVRQFWKVGSHVVGASFYTATVGVWPYPAGGTAKKTLTNFQNPFGVTISKAKR